MSPDPLKNQAATGDQAGCEWKTHIDCVVCVTAGPFTGRIGYSDGEEHIEEDNFSVGETLGYAENDIFPVEFLGEASYECEAIHFGHSLLNSNYYWIPSLALRVATASDMIKRDQEISSLLVQMSYTRGDRDWKEYSELFSEKHLIVDRIWEMERNAMLADGNGKTVFLCHSSADKPLVRRIALDLQERGFNPWLDEFEIDVGESIVEKISQATETADALIVFLSETSVAAPWVKKEWQSTFMRKLSGEKTLLIPARLDNCKIPPLLSDTRYADFRDQYLEPLAEICKAVAKHS